MFVAIDFTMLTTIESNIAALGTVHRRQVGGKE